MGILILLVVGMVGSYAATYWAHGVKVNEEDWLAKPIKKLQAAFDARAKERQ